MADIGSMTINITPVLDEPAMEALVARITARVRAALTGEELDVT